MRVTALLVFALLSVGPAASEEPDVHGFAVIPAFDPFSVVSVCPFRGSWSVAWHTPPGVDVEKATRARDHLNTPDFNDCLARIVSTDPATLAVVEKGIRGIDVSKDPPVIDVPAATASNEAVRKRWTSLGVDAAIREVADTGRRGEAVAGVLAACAKLEHEEGDKP